MNVRVLEDFSFYYALDQDYNLIFLIIITKGHPSKLDNN